MQTAIKHGADATVILVKGLRTAVPALFGVVTAPLLLVALPMFPRAVEPIRSLANVERARVGRYAERTVENPYRRCEGRHWQRVRATLGDPALWRDLVWLVVHGIGGTIMGLLAAALWPATVTSLLLPLYWWVFPPGTFTAVLVELRTWAQALTLPFLRAVLYAAVVCWVVPLWARGQLHVARWLLGPTCRARRVEEIDRLARSRSEALESHGAELRRIERDLHDGTQAQLVSVAVRWGIAERVLSTDPDTALTLLREARGGIEDSLTDLRSVIRSIHPPILTDRGLAGAVRTLAGGHHIPVSVRIPDELPRLSSSVEAVAYFVIAEALTNVTKHSRADHAAVDVDHVVDSEGARLRIRVEDNGRGGVDETAGTGLLGIRRRVAALDGEFRLSSTVGEGTVIEVSLPCG